MPLSTSEDIIPPLTHGLPLTFLLMILYLAVSVMRTATISILAPTGMPVCVLSRPQVTIAWILGLQVELTPVASRDYIIPSEEEEAAYRDWELGSPMAFSFSASLTSLLIDFGQLDNLFSFE